jgi:hypothetical protein
MEKHPDQWIAISDWGIECDELYVLSKAMAKFCDEHWRLDFVLSVGDNFYPSGE